MKHHIFNRESDSILTDEDGVSMVFISNADAYKYLKEDCQFTDDFIQQNYYLLKACKIIGLEDIPELNNKPNIIVEMPKTFTEADILKLQDDVHKLTGDGEVMKLFNSILGVCAG